MRTFLVQVGLLVLAGVTGCRSSRTDLIEAELRTRNQEIRQLRAELARAELTNRLLTDGVPTTHSPLTPHPLLIPPVSAFPEACPPTSPVPAPIPTAMPTVAMPVASGRPDADAPLVAIGPLEKIEIGTGSGGLDEDDRRGDERLLVVLVPRDPEGSAVKVPGTVYIRVLQFTPEGSKTPLSDWEIPPADLRGLWQSGLFSTGYYIRLAWKLPPTQERIRVVARLQLLEGPIYETDRDLTIHPPLTPVQAPPAFQLLPTPNAIPHQAHSAPVRLLPPTTRPH